jgi:guanylate kinase
MDKGAIAPGTDPAATHESILADELEKLKEYKLKLKNDNSDYLAEHPELRTLLDGFISEVLLKHPSDIIKFGVQYFNQLRDPSLAGPTPVVVAGPSGVGKGTLINMLMSKYPNIFGFSVSHTTRQPRPGEENGVHYHFVEKSEMERGIAANEFIEYAHVHTNIYGTSVKGVEKVRNTGKICILDIDIQGVKNVKNSTLDCRYVFVMPPSVEELEGRLRKRATETEEKIKVRMANATGEIEYGETPGNFDSVLVNDDLDVTLRQFVDSLKGWYPEMNWDAMG